MKVEINENINKSNPWVTVRLSDNNEIISFHKFEGANCFSRLEHFLSTESEITDKCTVVNYYRTSQDLSIISHFKHLEILSIRGGKTELKFDKVSSLSNLKTIHLNELTMPIDLSGIDKCKSLAQLYIGDFTFGKAINLITTKYLSKSKSIKELYFSNTQIEIDELKRLNSMKNLEFLTLNQKYEFEEFAELSVFLPNVNSNELKPWQNCQSEKGDIKVNGKRKPYLNSNKNKDRIKEYEKEFTKLQLKYATILDNDQAS